MVFYYKLEKVCEEKGVSVSPLLESVGLSKGNIARWKRGEEPKASTKHLLAKALEVPASVFLEDEAAAQPEDEELRKYLEELRDRPEKRMFFSLTQNATKEDVEAAVAIVEAFMKTRNIEEEK